MRQIRPHLAQNVGQVGNPDAPMPKPSEMGPRLYIKAATGMEARRHTGRPNTVFLLYDGSNEMFAHKIGYLTLTDIVDLISEAEKGGRW